MRFLRAHCDWDARQTPESLVRHLLEESLEVVDAIRGGGGGPLRDELGDLLLNLAFQVVIGEERGTFDAHSVAASLEAKMRRRHPHLFHGGEAVPWEDVKRSEHPDAHEDAGSPGASALDGPPAPPHAAASPGDMDGHSPLAVARVLQERAATVGFDWDRPQPAIAKIREESTELEDALAGETPEDVEDEVGDMLFAVVNVARLCGVDPVRALSRSNRKFSTRFRHMERLAETRKTRLSELDLARLDELWEEAKGVVG